METTNFEFPLLRKAKERVDLLLSSTTRRNAEGQPVGVVGVGQDITELNRVREEQAVLRQETDNAKSEFISTISHELRTPLTSIKGALSLIQAGVFNKSPDKLIAMIKIAYSNSQRLHQLIDEILDIEKLDAGRI
ncbi:MAG: signal transduction histidine kinase [Arenicella sp.]